MKKERKIIKFIKNNLLGFVIGGLIFGSVGVIADTIINSSNVAYKTSTVKGALDELYGLADLKEILIRPDAGSHNSIYRGKDVTSYYTDGTLYTRISDGSFEDLYVGDYIVKNGVNWRIAGFDIYYGKGDTALTTHHVVIVPDTSLTSSVMNDTNVTEGGYVGSKMYTETLPNVLSTYITPVFGSHVLEYRNILTTSVNTSLYNRYGSNTGASNNWTWQTRKLDLMNENQVPGGTEWSSSGNETGSDNIQFPLFRLKPEFVNKQRIWYWLRNVTSSSAFAGITDSGYNGTTHASNSEGVRPYFYID